MTNIAEISKRSGQQVVDRGHLTFIWEREACQGAGQSSGRKKTQTPESLELRQQFVVYLWADCVELT